MRGIGNFADETNSSNGLCRKTCTVHHDPQPFLKTQIEPMAILRSRMKNNNDKQRQQKTFNMRITLSCAYNEE